MPDLVHRIETHVEARPDELWTLGQTIRYVRDRDVAWTRLAPPFTAGHVPSLEGQKALWALWRDIAAGTISSPEDIRARGIVNPSPLTPVTREAIFDLWRELAAGTVRPIEDHREVHPSRWSLEARLILNFQEKQGETTGDFGPFLAEVERLMGELRFLGTELTRVFPRRTPFPLAVEPPAMGEPAEADGPTAPAKKDKKDPIPTRPEVQPRRSRVQETAAALLRIYPESRGSDSYDVMLNKLEGGGLIVGRTTLVRALQKLGPNWRIEPH